MAEVGLIVEAMDRQLPVLGVCLGAQLLALAAGGSVHAGPAAEIGWGPVQFTDAAGTDPLFEGIPAHLEVLHWHGDTYVPPPGAVHLASSAAYVEQAFRCGTTAWGLQFHLEVDQGAVDGYLAAFADEARSAGADPEEIRRATPGMLDRLGPFSSTVLGRFARLVAEPAGTVAPALGSARVIEPA
jgi:GMP synthase-like glutamine amidotransferase